MALLSVERHVRSTIANLFDTIRASGNGDYIGEAVSQLEHSLQCALRAKDDNCDDDTVLAALLHDVGRFVPAAKHQPKQIGADGAYLGIMSHDVLGEQYLRSVGFSEKICQLVGAHVTAKRYLCATEPGYFEALSRSSKRTLDFQGGVYNEEQVKQAQRDPWLQEKLAVRRYDDLAKVANLPTPSIDAYTDMAIASLLSSSSIISVDSRTYNLPREKTAIFCVQGLGPFANDTTPNFARIAPDGSFMTLKAVSSPTTAHQASILSLLAKRGVRVAATSTLVKDRLEKLSGDIDHRVNLLAVRPGQNWLSIVKSVLSLFERDEVDFAYLDLVNTSQEGGELLDRTVHQLMQIGVRAIVMGLQGSGATQQASLWSSRAFRSEQAVAEKSWSHDDVFNLALNR